ncbi:6-bladed beta-propeller, partial [Aquimarina sp. U1-2]
MSKYFSLIFIVLCLSCKNPNQTKVFFKNPVKVAKNNKIFTDEANITNISVDLSSIIKGNFYDYFDIKNVIHLDMQSLIGDISVIRQHGDYIFILDSKNAKQLFCYNLTGELVWEYKSIGKGP